jgi:hypothetical protein
LAEAALPGGRTALLGCRNGGGHGIMDWIVAAVIFIFIVAVLVVLWRREHR